MTHESCRVIRQIASHLTHGESYVIRHTSNQIILPPRQRVLIDPTAPPKVKIPWTCTLNMHTPEKSPKFTSPCLFASGCTLVALVLVISRSDAGDLVVTSDLEFRSEIGNDYLERILPESFWTINHITRQTTRLNLLDYLCSLLLTRRVHSSCTAYSRVTPLL